MKIEKINQHADKGLDEVIEITPFEMMYVQYCEFETFRWIAAIVILKEP